MFASSVLFIRWDFGRTELFLLVIVVDGVLHLMRLFSRALVALRTHFYLIHYSQAALLPTKRGKHI